MDAIGSQKVDKNNKLEKKYTEKREYTFVIKINDKITPLLAGFHLFSLPEVTLSWPPSSLRIAISKEICRTLAAWASYKSAASWRPKTATVLIFRFKKTNTTTRPSSCSYFHTVQRFVPGGATPTSSFLGLSLSLPCVGVQPCL